MAANMKKFQTAAVIENPGPSAEINIRNDVPVDEPGPNEILVKLAFSGICGSEVRAFLGYGPYRPIVGHEGVGIVVKLGEQVEESLFGQRVGVKWLFSACGQCSICLKGFHNNCPNQINTGRQVSGTFQQYVVADARYVTRIPENVPGEVASPLLCAGLTMAGAVSKLDAQLEKDDWVVISGSGGGLGHIGVQIASRLRGYRVIAVDAGQSKRNLSLSCGALHFIDFVEEDVEKRVKDLTGEGAHSIVVVSGSEAAFRLAPKLVRNRGLIVAVGLPRNDFDIPIPATLCSARALTVTGVATGTEDQMTELLQFAAAGKIEPAVEVTDFAEISQVFNKLKNDKITGRIVIRIPQ
ncbi:chaperonin 10-like protein [Dactylonectria estremocensis]|uniref:Chaperonin 10-like protein n=1 Tax=Dactylonectria estremocensis TaxID=1079267 RepID=A0A9P9EQP2_9HYPO|nr:chaperonin 10-like protein [Dactylonectria estremocensis]